MCWLSETPGKVSSQEDMLGGTVSFCGTLACALPALLWYCRIRRGAAHARAAQLASGTRAAQHVTEVTKSSQRHDAECQGQIP